jgi:hypothetical protein
MRPAFNPANWNNGVPPSALTAVGNGGTAQIAGAPANAGFELHINGGSTVDLQAGGSLTTGGGILLGTAGTLLLSGSTAVTGGPIGFLGGTLRSALTGTVSSDIIFSDGTTSTIAAAAG